MLVEHKVAMRYAADVGGVEEFKKVLEAALHIGDRQIKIRDKSAFGSDMIFVNYINLPSDVSGSGAEAENNRLMFSIEGFAKDPNAPPPTGKVSVKLSVSALDSKYKLRAKTGTPSQIAKYIADFLNTVAKEVEPNFTHTKR